MKRKVLGKGLNALIPDIDIKELDQIGVSIKEVPVEKIVPNRHQPRKIFNDEHITELANSIKEKGMVQPIIVAKREKGFELVAGERRLRAAKKLNQKKILAIIKDIEESQLLELALIENIQRENLNPLEEAQAYKQLIERHNYTQEEAAVSVGKDRSSVANFLRLLKLPDNVKKLIRDRDISMGHARALLGLDSSRLQEEVGAAINTKRLSVRQTEQIVSNIKKRIKEDKAHTPPKGVIDDGMEENLRNILKTRVKIKKGKRGGNIHIYYSGKDELRRICNLLTGRQHSA